MSSPGLPRTPVARATVNARRAARVELGRLDARRLALSLVLVACTAMALTWHRLAFARFDAVHHQTFDLAEYARLAWGLAHGQPWDSLMGGHFFGGHVPFVLAPLGFVGRAFGTVPTLLVAQSFALALPALPLALLALRRIGPLAALLTALAYLCYPNLGHVATYELHPGNFALLPLAWALLALDRGDARTLVLCGLATLACRVSLALEVTLLGLSAALPSWLARRDARAAHPSRVVDSHATLARAGALLAVLAFGYLLLSVLVLRPRFGGGGASGSFDLHFAKWGGSPIAAMLAPFTAPARVLAHLAAPERLRYLPMVLAPLALVPLLAPRIALIAAPTLAINLLSEFPTTTRIDSHYLTPAVPVLVAAAVYGCATLLRIANAWFALGARVAHGPHVRLPPLPARAALPFVAAICGCSMLASALASGMPYSRDFDARAFRPDAFTQAARRVLARIPNDASVQAPDALLPHLAERTAVFRAPPPDRGASFVALDLSHRRRFAHREDVLRTQQEPLVRGWLARRDRRVVVAAGDLVLLERSPDVRAGLVARYFVTGPEAHAASQATGIALTACLSLLSADLDPGAIVLTLRAEAPCAEDLALRIGYAERPTRVDLLFDGLLSPAHLRAGDLLRSRHVVTSRDRRRIAEHGVRVGVLRSSGARPEPSDPTSVWIGRPRR